MAENLKSTASEQEKAEILKIKVVETQEKLVSDCRSYYGPLLQPYNTLLLVWTVPKPY